MTSGPPDARAFSAAVLARSPLSNSQTTERLRLASGAISFDALAKDAKTAFSDMATTILADLAKMILRMTITARLAAALEGIVVKDMLPSPSFRAAQDGRNPHQALFQTESR